jgi:hypothetical protein
VMSDSAKGRFIVNDLPTYLRGGRKGFGVELEHDFNLGGAAAVFYGQEKQEGADPFSSRRTKR